MRGRGVVALGSAVSITGAVTLAVLLAASASQPSPAGGGSTTISAIAPSPGYRTLAIRAGKVNWLALDPTRWTLVALPSHFVPPLAGSMHPTVVAVTDEGVGLVGMSNGVVLAVAPGSEHAAAVVADYMPGRVVALAGMGDLGHLQLLVSTSFGTYSVGLKDALAVWWPHREATALVAPPNSQGAWAAVVAGRLAWAALPEPAASVKGLPVCASFALAGGPQPKPRTGPCAMPGPGGGWTLATAASTFLGHSALLAESPDGTVAIATHSGAVLAGFPGEGLVEEMHTVAAVPLGPAATALGLVATYSPSGVGNVLALVAAGTPLLVDGWSGWGTDGGPVRVRLAAGVGSDVVEVQPSGSVRVVNLYQPGLAWPAPERPVPSWVGPALGSAALVVFVVLLALAARRLPDQARRVVLATVAAGSIALGGVAIGRFVVPIGRYSRSQVQLAWQDGGGAAGTAASSVILTVAQCATVAEAVGWRGPLPTSVTAASAFMPREVVPSCQWVFVTPAWWQRMRAQEPLNRRLDGGGPVDERLDIGLGPQTDGGPGSPAAAACSALGARCQPGILSGIPDANVVSLVIPPKLDRLFAELLGPAKRSS